MEFTQEFYAFELIAWIFLPDHFHSIIYPHENTLSDIIRIFKQKFSGLYRSRHSLTRGRIWQYRFWDHVIRNQDDFNRHLDYIHLNPVKHGLIRNPFEYGYSSIHEFDYPEGWGIFEASSVDGDFGE
jgi:putative transposase